MPTVGVIGTGLIGASIAGGLTTAGWETIGYDPDCAAIETALDRGLVGAASSSLDEILSERLDILVIAAPPRATMQILTDLETDTVVMDVAGIKGEILAVAKHLKSFVGSHPMAGRETSGPTAASAALFRGANWVVIDGCEDEARERVVNLIETLGANPVFMAAAHHDRAVASVSHLPQIIAAGLLAAAADTPEALDLAAGSFRDLTRVAASRPSPWVEILKMNGPAVLEAFEAIRAQLLLAEAAIGADDDSLLAYLASSQDVRRSLGSPEIAVRVALVDEPGEMARVGHALAESGVDVRDIQMRHAPHGGGGVLTLSVRAGEEEALRHALTHEGLLALE